MPTRREVLAHEILHVKNPKFSEKTVRKLHPIYAKAGFEHVKVGRTGELSISGTPSGTYSFWESIGYGRIQKKGEKSFLKLGKHVVVTMLPAAEAPTELGGGVTTVLTTVLKTKPSLKTAPFGIREMVSKVVEKELSLPSIVPPSPLLKFKPSYLSHALNEERMIVELPITKLRTKEFLEVETKVKGVQKTVSRLRSDVRLKTDTILRNVSMLKSHLGLDTETRLRTETKLGYELKTESKTRTSTEMSVPFVPPPVIIIPRLGVDIFIPRGKGGLFRRPKFKPRYTPSVMAGMFNIRGKQPRMITGLETRPLPLLTKRRRRK